MFIQQRDKVILSDMLYFIYNKLQTTPHDNVISICDNFYNDADEVFMDKQKLFTAMNEKCIARRGSDRKTKDLEDILNMISSRDSLNLPIPKFASLSLNNVPSTPDGTCTMSQVLSSLRNLQKNLVTKETLDSALDQLRNEMDVVKSSPSEAVIPPHHNGMVSTQLTVNNVGPLIQSTEDILVNPVEDKPQSKANPVVPGPSQIVNSQTMLKSVLVGDGKSPFKPSPPTTWPELGGASRRGIAKPVNSKENRERNHRSPSRGLIIGKKVTDGLISLRGVDQTVNRYVGNIDVNAQDEDVKKHLREGGVEVVELERLPNKHQRFKSFRLRIKKKDLQTIENSEFWPENVVLRFFRRPRQQHDGTSATFPAS